MAYPIASGGLHAIRKHSESDALAIPWSTIGVGSWQIEVYPWSACGLCTNGNLDPDGWGNISQRFARHRKKRHR